MTRLVYPVAKSVRARCRESDTQRPAAAGPGTPCGTSGPCPSVRTCGTTCRSSRWGRADPIAGGTLRARGDSHFLRGWPTATLTAPLLPACFIAFAPALRPQFTFSLPPAPLPSASPGPEFRPLGHPRAWGGCFSWEARVEPRLLAQSSSRAPSPRPLPHLELGHRGRQLGLDLNDSGLGQPPTLKATHPASLRGSEHHYHSGALRTRGGAQPWRPPRLLGPVVSKGSGDTACTAWPPCVASAAQGGGRARHPARRRPLHSLWLSAEAGSCHPHRQPQPLSPCAPPGARPEVGALAYSATVPWNPDAMSLP